MARLNEPLVQAAPVESVEALKRRFLRQNREIARANSTQSLRIRSLEAETSRLLSENLVLREKVISLEHELESRPKREAIEDLGLVKDKLEAKLAELGGLVFELGRAQKSAITVSAPSRRQSVKNSSQGSPDQRRWKNALTLSDVTGRQDGRLPSIVEDKYYPRRTLDSEELLGILKDQVDSANSPDLGPPPIAHFDDGDPVKQDDGLQASLDNNSGNMGSLAFTNLETRRKRRESTFSKEPAPDFTSNLPTSLENTSTSIGPLSSQPLKLGAKRKLSVRDDEERIDAFAAAVKDDFRFNRRTETTNEPFRDVGSIDDSHGGSVMSRKMDRDLANTRVDKKENPREVSLKSTNSRKALGEKSVNTDPVLSPRKPSKATLEDKVADIKKDISKKPHDRERSRVKSSAPRPVRSIQDTERKSKSASITEEVLPLETEIVIQPTEATIVPPVTPIYPDLDLLSPISSQPTTSRPDTRDTPPPGDIHPDASSTSSISATGRTTRRPRGSVSYAEPNLRDKMRRPGKELVDAVGADERIQRAASVKAEDRPVGQSFVVIDADAHISHGSQRAESARLRTVVIKKEEGTEDHEEYRARDRKQGLEARAEPQSPLSAKTAAVGDLPSSVLMDRKKRVSEIPHSKETEQNSAVAKTAANANPSSGSSSAITALIAGTRTKQSNNHKDDIERYVKPRDEALQAAVSAASDVYDFQGSSDVEVKHSSAHTRSSSTSSIMEAKPVDVGERVRLARRSSSVTDINGSAPYMKSATGSIRGRKRRETLSAATESEESTVKLPVEGVGKPEVGTRAERAVARRRSMLV